jgi:formamidopyrimidine-DNA glycosylase
MLEIPESKTIALQAGKLLAGRTIVDVRTATRPHKFAFYCGDPLDYAKLLSGRHITSSDGHGMFVDLHVDGNSCITVGDGTNLRYYAPSEPRPEKHQLLIELDDGGCLTFTVAMYGGIWAYRGTFDNKYHQGSLNSISPLDGAFDESYFTAIMNGVAKDISVKALLATEQRIPGLGNGVLQDILFNARLHPKRKKSTLSDNQKAGLYRSLKTTLKSMTEPGGRDTEKDLFGRSGGYKTLLSKNTVKNPCPNCHAAIVKEAYLGGAVYFCPECQKL